MPTPQYIITPWRDDSELQQVCASLYKPTSPTDHAQGIARVQAWKLRGNIPHAVESAGQLFSAAKFHNVTIERQAHDTDPNNAVADSFAIRATYTLALSRFVTGFADVGRHRDGAGQTMQEVARGLGLPATFVEIRHEATHEAIPTLDRLRKATTEALHWLYVMYWTRFDAARPRDAAAAAPQRVIPDLRNTCKLVDKLKAFRSRRLAALAKKKTSKTKDTLHKDVQETAKMCKAMIDKGDIDIQELAEVLIGDRMIIPSKLDRYGVDAQHKGARLIWNELLLALHSCLPTLMQDVLIIIFQELSELEPVAIKAYSDPRYMLESWVMEFCTSPAWRNAVPNFDVVRWTAAACCLCPSAMSYQIAGRILDEDDILGTDVDATWRPMLEASSISDDAMRASDRADGTPPNDLEGEEMIGDTRLPPGWKLDDDFWIPIPIGVCYPRS